MIYVSVRTRLPQPPTHWDPPIPAPLAPGRTGGSTGITASCRPREETMAAPGDTGRVRGAALPPDPAAGSGSDAAGESDRRVLVPMNLFATWEIDRSSPSCVPR